MSKVRGIRGATTAEDNTQQGIIEATKELLENIVQANDINPDDVAAATFTTTSDLNAEYPALAARLLGWNYVALMGGAEVDVPGAPERCIRVLVLLNTDKSAQELSNIYLRGAANLRSRTMD